MQENEGEIITKKLFLRPRLSVDKLSSHLCGMTSHILKY